MTDEHLATIMKLALEFNAAIVTLCTMYYGNMDYKNPKRFQREYERLVKRYQRDLELVSGTYAKQKEV